MPRGRCSGCGRESASARAIRDHIVSCPKYLELYRTSPERALDPEEEARAAQEHRQTEAYDEERRERKDANARRYRDANERRVEVAQERWRRGAPETHTPAPAPENGRLSPPPDTPGGWVEENYWPIMAGDPTT